MSRRTESRIHSEIVGLVSDYFTRVEAADARHREVQRRRDSDLDVIAIVAGVIVGATIGAVHTARRP